MGKRGLVGQRSFFQSHMKKKKMTQSINIRFALKTMVLLDGPQS